MGEIELQTCGQLVDIDAAETISPEEGADLVAAFYAGSDPRVVPWVERGPS